MGGVEWGGSEELWSQCATLFARDPHFEVAACVKGWAKPHKRISELSRVGVNIKTWGATSVPMKLLKRLKSTECEVLTTIENISPDIIVCSTGSNVPKKEFASALLRSRRRFINISQANSPNSWFSDSDAKLYQCYLSKAVVNAFVSRTNLELLENQIGTLIKNHTIVKNPLNPCVAGAQPNFRERPGQTVSFANVARLHPESKGQDILLRVLAGNAWRSRDWSLCFYGSGPQQHVLQQLVEALELKERIYFKGHLSDVNAIWAQHDMLLLPSRYEGMPLALIEAMSCGRPSVATDVGDVGVLVKEGVTGCLAEAPTIQLYSAALERMWTLRPQWTEISVNARRHVESWLDGDPVNQFRDLVLSCLD